MSRSYTPLRLAALDAPDLEPVSAALQDAVAQLGDFEFAAKKRCFTMAFNRFCWEVDGRAQRVRTGVQVGAVSAARSQNIRQGAEDAVVNLLSMGFEAAEDGAGEIVLVFSGGGELRLAVECVDVVLVDLNRPWPASSRPEHGNTAGDTAEEG